jgi:isopentenyl-diphosphate delta-isomerase
MELIKTRKTEHLRICLEQQVETGDPLWDEVTLVHQALPELSFDAIDTSCAFLGKQLAFPLVIAGMTGGCDEAREINRCLALVAEKKGVAFGVGSQRAMIENPALAETYAVREVAPNILLLGNIGITALKKYPSAQIVQTLQTIGADAVCVHINPAQEIFQSEGDRNFSGCLEALTHFCKAITLPVIAKEVGNGISHECALKLKAAGVSAIDVGGLGGTSWVLIDSIRAGIDSAVFRNWGIPTAVSVMECQVGLPVIATGGIRTGLQMAKAIALGADLCGIALPFLRILSKEGTAGVERYLDTLKADFIRALFLTGCRTVADLKNARYMLIADLKNRWGLEMKYI